MSLSISQAAGSSLQDVTLSYFCLILLCDMADDIASAQWNWKQNGLLSTTANSLEQTNFCSTSTCPEEPNTS